MMYQILILILNSSQAIEFEWALCVVMCFVYRMLYLSKMRVYLQSKIMPFSC